MPTLDNINLFANGGPTGNSLEDEYRSLVAVFDTPAVMGSPPSFEEFVAMRQKSQAADTARQTMTQELGAGNVKKAYEEGFTQLPIMEQLGTYVFPPTGIPIESYETAYFADEAGFGLKSPKEFALDVLNPTKNIFQKLPVKAEDPMSAVLAPLSALGAAGGIGELANIPKAGLMALRRMNQKTMDGGGGGGIGGLPPDAFEADVNRFALDPSSGIKSPTIESLIRNAPKNLKGKQITDWLNSKGAPSKGVKPKELPFLKIDRFIEENPNATISDVVQHAGDSKITIDVTSYKDIGEPGSDFYFETTTPEFDPLDSSYKNSRSMVDLVKDDTESYGNDLVDLYNSYRTSKMIRTNSEEGIPPKIYDYDEITDEGLAQLDIDRDTLFEDLGDGLYKYNPYILTEPQGTGLVGDTSGTFTFGNDDVGYQTFINGERADLARYGYSDVAYSQAEAEIRLQNIMEQEEMIDMGMYGGEQRYKNYVDSTLPGGKNYEEKVYTYENADESIDGLAHFDDDNQIAHMLGRDRVLEDGTVSKHADEIQSDLHKRGLQYGYKNPVKDANTVKQIEQSSRESYRLHQKVIKTMRDELEEIKALSEKHPELKKYQGEYDYLDKDLAIRQLGAEDFGTIEFKNDADLQTFREHLRTRYGDSATIEDFGVPNKIQLLEEYVTKRESELDKFTKDKYGISRDGFSYRASSEIDVMNGTPEEVKTVLKEFRKLVNEPNYAKKINKIDKLSSESTALIDNATETFLMDLARFNQQYPDANTTSIMTYAKIISKGRENTGRIFESAYKALRDAELNVLSERANLDLDTLADPRNIDVTNPALAKLLDADLSFRETPVTVKKQIINLEDKQKQLRSLRDETTIDPEKFFDTMDNTSEDLMSIRNIDRDISSEITKINNKAPDYPFKGDDYAEMVIKNMIMDAISEGKAAVSVSASPAVVARYSQQEAEFFPRFYDKTIPNMMEKLAKKYGGDFERGSLNLEDTFGEPRTFYADSPITYSDVEIDNAKANIIRITPEMRDKILKEGLPSMYMGGKVSKSNSMDRPIVGNRREM